MKKRRGVGSVLETNPGKNEIISDITLGDMPPVPEVKPSKYAGISVGSQGADVNKIKDLLRANGYSGFKNNDVFGKKASEELRRYQAANGLNPNGAADDATWEMLRKKFDLTTPSGNDYNSMDGSGNKADLGALEGEKPGAYKGTYTDQINGLFESIMNREKFNYDMNADPLYNQYKDQYISGGRNAMLDTMGNAAALTGGYGNSYASTAGNQAYQGHLQGLNDKALDLYGMAYGQYRDDGNDMRDNLSAALSRDQMDYGRYRDQYGDWQSNRDYAYGKTQDDQTQSNWQAEYELALSKAKKKGGGGGGGGGSRGGGGGRRGSGSGGGSGGGSGSSGSAASGTSEAKLRQIALNMFNGSSSSSDGPIAAVDRMSGYSSAEKDKIKAYIRSMM